MIPEDICLLLLWSDFTASIASGFIPSTLFTSDDVSVVLVLSFESVEFGTSTIQWYLLYYVKLIELKTCNKLSSM